MILNIYDKSEQVKGNFNNGEILENKPIGFPHDGGKLKSYSNIFYWAHAWTSDKKSTIGLHPHQGFEICSFILRGKINHFDTKQNKWIQLSKGDVQIIRAGNGISHAEELEKNSEIFQIWFDPNLEITLKNNASYDDYSFSQFKENKNNISTTTIIKGEGSPMKMETEGITIQLLDLKKGSHFFNASKKNVHSIFILDGEIELENKKNFKGTFLTISQTDSFEIFCNKKSKIFKVTSPLLPSYRTYA